MAVTAFSPTEAPNAVVAITTAGARVSLRIGTARPSTMRSRCAAISAASSAPASLRLIELAKKKTPVLLDRKLEGNDHLGTKPVGSAGSDTLGHVRVGASGQEWHTAPSLQRQGGAIGGIPCSVAFVLGPAAGIEVDPAPGQRSGERAQPLALADRLSAGLLRGP